MENVAAVGAFEGVFHMFISNNKNNYLATEGTEDTEKNLG
jgi:hypothetical protein